MRLVVELTAVTLAMLGCMSVTRYVSLREALEQLSHHPSSIPPAQLERLILTVRRVTGASCTHAALTFRALHGGKLHLGVLEDRPHLGHAWIVDHTGREWLKGAGAWKAVWVEGK